MRIIYGAIVATCQWIVAVDIPAKLKLMKIEYYRREVYGNEMWYVVNSEIEGWVSMLTNRATLSNGDMKALQALGFELVEVLQPEK